VFIFTQDTERIGRDGYDNMPGVYILTVSICFMIEICLRRKDRFSVGDNLVISNMTAMESYMLFIFPHDHRHSLGWVV